MKNFSINIVDQSLNQDEVYNTVSLVPGMSLKKSLGSRFPLRLNEGTPEVSSCTYLES